MKEQINGIKEGVEIDLQKLLLAYLRQAWLIVLCGVIAALGTFYVTANHITPLYRTSVTIYVNNTKSNDVVEYVDGSSLSTSARLVATYVNIIRSDTVLTKVVEKSGLDFTAEEIRGMMTTSQLGNTEMFQVFITYADPVTAAEVANAIAEVAPGEIGNFVEGSSTKIIDYAKIPTTRHSPNYRKNTLLGGIVGIAAAVLYITLRYLLDVRLKDSEDLEMIFDIPVLGQIPSFASADAKKKSGYGYETTSAGKGR